jgi:hypothetical protein
MVEIRKIITMREVVLSELGVAASRPVVRAVGMAVIRNPFAGGSSTIFSRCSKRERCSASG